MRALHSLRPPVVHRNLNSFNIFLSFDIPLSHISEDMAIEHPLAKVGDFGLSQFSFFDFKATKGEGAMGNINARWTAPEVLGGRPYSIQSDVYSLGLLLWEIKYRKVVFEGVGGDGPFAMEELSRYVAQGGRPEVDLNDSYDELCAACWIENPLQRPDASEVVERLVEIAKVNAPSLYAKMCDVVNENSDVIVSSSSSSSGVITRSFEFSNSFLIENDRITCSTNAEPFIWFGCRNGKIGVFNTENNEVVFADEDLCGTISVVHSI